jgi:hypothetical protein
LLVPYSTCGAFAQRVFVLTIVLFFPPLNNANSVAIELRDSQELEFRSTG